MSKDLDILSMSDEEFSKLPSPPKVDETKAAYEEATRRDPTAGDDMAEHGTDPNDVDEDEAAVVAEGTGTGVPESVPDAYQEAAEASAAIRGGADPDG